MAEEKEKPEWLDGKVEWLEDLKKGKKPDKKDDEEKPPEKKWFEVKVEGTVPVTIRYRIFAEDEDKAFEEYMRGNAQLLEKPAFDLRKTKKRRVSIRNTTSAIVKWVKNFY